MIPETVVKNLSLGMVLDTKGKWVPLSQPLAIERGVLRHLEAGEVMFEGKWIPIAQCLASRACAAPGSVGGELKDAQANDAEHISTKKGIPWVVVSCETGEQHLAPSSLLPLIRQSGASIDGEADPWESSKGLPLYVKAIGIAAASIAALGIIVWAVLKVFF